ncbi:MAG: tripartite tricarboxylate transporter permease [Pseudomonadota bacterium]
MENLTNLVYGFQILFQPTTLFFCFLGCVVGTLVGVLPGLGPAATISILLPTTLAMTPVSAIVMLAGIYYGAMYGGSTTSILMNIPGEAASVITCLDGYQMARQGRAGPALGISAIGSFFAGTIAVLGMMLLAPPLAEMTLAFGPPEYFSLIVCGMTLVTFLARGKMWKALLMAAVGLFLSTIGTDSLMGATRFNLDIPELTDGIGLVPVVMGLFGIAEVLLNLEQTLERSIFETKIKNILPTLKDFADSIFPVLRGTLIGFFIGILPGGGSVLPTFVAYAVEKKVSKNPEKFGTGMIQGVASPESANNAANTATFIPLLTLGLPPNATMAILFGALMMYGLQPGPMLIQEHPEMFWGLIASMYLGNVMLLLLNLPLIGLWVKVLKVPYPILFPLILMFCLIGAYSLNNSIAEVLIMCFFGLLGYLFNKFKYEGAPLVLALVLGSRLEASLRRSLLLEQGDLMIFFNRPISAVLLIFAIFLLIVPMVPWLKKRMAAVPKE